MNAAIQRLGHMLIVLLLLGYGGWTGVWAETPQEPSSGLPPEVSASIGAWVDNAHAGISQQVLGTADRFDGFFGDERINEEKQNTQISLGMSSTIKRHAAPVISFPVGITLSLPRLENRVQLAVDTLLQEESDPRAEAASEDEAQNRDIQIRLRYKMLEQIGKWMSMDGGVKMNFDTIGWNTLEPFGALRLRSTFDFDPWAIRVTQLANWYGQSGWSGLSGLDLERYSGQNTFFRISGTTQYAEEFTGQHYTVTLFLRYQLTHNRAVGLQFSSEGHTDPILQTDVSETLFTYRRRIYKEWAFLTIQPAARYTRKAEEHFVMRPLLRVDVELYFGRVGP